MPRLSYPIERSRDSDRVTERLREILESRAAGLRLFILLLFSVLAFRLYSLQFIAGERYAGEARRNVEIRVVTDPVRGRIMDRSGNILVSNEPFFRIVFDRSWGGRGSDGLSQAEARRGIEELAHLLGWDRDKRESTLALIPNIYRGWVEERARSSAGYVILEDRVRFEDLVRIEERQKDLPGIRVEEREQRKYYRGRMACHLLGYTGQISREDYASLKDRGYRMTDWIGRDGLERAFDERLRGLRGVSWQRRYANNLVEEEIIERRVPPTPGEDLYLSLDIGLQELAENILDGRKGGIAAVDPRTGQILALASGPGFDLNFFRGGIRAEDYRRLQADPGNVFVDRSIGKGGGGYPPGSVFKIVTTIAALEEGIISPQTTFHCGGSIAVGRNRKRCHQRRGHGALDLYGGFRASCDVYYYHTGERLGPELLAKYARGLGLGSKTGLPPELHEAPGLVPDPGWKIVNSRFGSWGLGDTLNTAIGQGFLLVTPLQMAALTAYVANGGKLLAPQIVSHIRDATGEITWRPDPTVRDSIPVSTETIAILQECMRRVVNEPGGTGRASQIKGITVAGKTGTAEHYRKESDAWFCCYAPFENPEIALAVAIEGGGHGGATSAPIAKTLLEYYFRDRLAPDGEQVALP
ncbi:MAG: penicillin-binding protein 2 [Candidatus Omnitrophica bacterium]|nr:Peptidoglycan D,D-transpeptidase MrdA [bacterium]NUN94861.1 penicillin-binding protein 2 [Candidatus Omnitrophota bacterium]